MTTDPLQRVDCGIWLTIGAVAAIDMLAGLVGSFTIAWANLGVLVGVSALLVAAGYYFRVVRRDERIALLFICNVQMMCFAIFSAALSYVVASAALPAWDATLAAWDARLSLRWTDWQAVMDAHPAWHLALRSAYMGLIGQPVLIIVILIAAGQLTHLRLFLASTVATILIVVSFSMLCPAVGTGLGPLADLATQQSARPASWVSAPIFDGLRDGTYRHLFTPDAEGIVTFPSYHAAAGLLGIFALWPVRYIRWIGLIVNVAMIAATPVDGGHYFVDVIAGLAVAALVWMAAMRIIARSAAESAPPSLAACDDAPSLVPGLPVVQREPMPHTARSEVI